ncbi:hypothetical protein GCM10010230_55670 [Streptomyces narbonensis]|nr:hypothetical protein GCM10010230_55670 [Streptomyces narbonensis]
MRSDTKEAIATSLFVVGVTSLAALVPHARARRVRWRTGLLFGAFSMAGAPWQARMRAGAQPVTLGAWQVGRPGSGGGDKTRSVS